MILVIDNYDSFTYNLVQYLGELGAVPLVVRNDELSAEQIASRKPEGIVISPGPCTPREAGESCAVLKGPARTIPTLGVCLGHQCLGDAFGAEVVRAPKLMHGKTSMISHDGGGVFAGLANPFEATRYHSLIVREESLPAALEICARSEDGLIMGLRHREFPIHGVQFHPESILTIEGKKLVGNFLAMCGGGRRP